MPVSVDVAHAMQHFTHAFLPQQGLKAMWALDRVVHMALTAVAAVEAQHLRAVQAEVHSEALDGLRGR